MFGGQDVTAMPIEKRGVGMVFQHYALFPNMTVEENIGYGLKIKKVPSAERLARVDRLLEMVQLQHLGHRRIDQLSGGQKQRVALARALAVEPKVLLLDEPLTALDAKLRESLRADLNQLLRSLGITTIYVTHDQGEAMALGDRVVVMERGRIAQVGSPQDIYYRPATRFVADFIGSMNRLAGTVYNGRLQCRGGSLPFEARFEAMSGGCDATLMFRPEDVEVVDGDGGNADLSGTITSTFFMGDKTRLLIDVGGEAPVIAESRRRITWHIGEPVALHVPRHALMHFEGETHR